MRPLDIREVVEFVENNIGDFHGKRLTSLEKLELEKVLKRKNPYLFKAKNILAAGELVKVLLDAHLSSQEETIFGEFLERLAIFVAGRVFGGKKSAAVGIDLEMEVDGIIYLIAIKSGPNWGNSDQISKMKANFVQAQRILRTNNPNANVRAINGCCYGRNSKKDKGTYLKLCGQSFWSLISGNENLYLEIIEPLGHRAKERNDEFVEEYSKILNRFTAQFISEFCNSDGAIDWQKLVKLNSGSERLPRKPRKEK
ncbi:MAG: cytosolic protein [Chloroflexi bacterium]|nr:cytosolic protein [Chloroflexota bacterium]MBI3158428.1 cytosolic protein [Chloroflexota bacterium]